MKRAATILFWALPPLVLLAVHGIGLAAWFQQDDFVWLGLAREVGEGRSIPSALFAPSQHGTWRPLSERAYFLLGAWLFGAEAWPLRAVAFATQIASLALAQRILLRLSGSRWAALAAPALWAASQKLTMPMVANGMYVHVLGGFLLLAATWFLLTGRPRAMWAAFLAGFLATEMNVVFPAMATLYAALLDRGKLWQTLWLWPASVTYYLLHMKYAPKMAAGSYALTFDASIVPRLGRYTKLAFEAENLRVLTGLPDMLSAGSALLLPSALAAFVVWSLLRREPLPLLLAGWFLILLSPVLPLGRGVSDYYLTVPLAALTMLLAMLGTRRFGIPFLVLYLLVQAPAAVQTTRWWQRRGEVAEKLVRTVWAVHRANPGRCLVLEGVSDGQFWSAIAHYPFVERRSTYVYLAQDTRARITPYPDAGVRIEEFFLPAAEEQRCLRFRVPAP